MNKWVFQRKISFNSKPSKQAQGLLISKKVIKTTHPQYNNNNIPFSKAYYQKQLGLILDSRVIFDMNLNCNENFNNFYLDHF